MDPLGEELNRLLVQTYHSVGRIEESMLYRLSAGRLGLTEMHAMSRIGPYIGGESTISELSREMDITPPSVTVMIQRLEKKGYVVKQRSARDGRQVRVRLTEEGRKAVIAYRWYSRKVVNAVRSNIEPEDFAVMLRSFRRVNEYFMREADVLEGGAPGGEE